ncbi:MAG: ABC transporter permease [Chloroflexi bacterium]|nr:MAG: ABC transporter permease [Chloroflexota bacterium]
MTKKTFLIARHEFWRHITRRSFIFAVVGLPLILVLIFAGAIIFFSSKEDQPVGIVDQAGITLPPADYERFLESVDEESVPWVQFSDEDTALTALKNGEIQAYVVLPEDYLTSHTVKVYHQRDALDSLSLELTDYLRVSLLTNEAPELRESFWEVPATEFVSLAGEDTPNPFSVVVVYLTGFLFLIAVFTTAGFLIQAVVDEKENRTMEILVTSAKPEQVLIGKIIGLVGLGFVQFAIWAIFATVGLLVARSQIPVMPELTITPVTAVVIIGWFIPFYIMIAALMTAIGITVTAASEGQQAASIISLLSMLPLYLTFIFLERPNSGIAILLSLIPFSSPLTMLARVQVTEVSPSFLLLSWLILVGSTALAVFLVGKLFRLGMLRYGQKITLREIWRLLWPFRSSTK